MANGSVRIEGLEALERQVRVLSPKGRRRVWRNAFRDAGRSVLQKEARKNLKSMGYSALAKDVTTKASATNANTTVRIGAKAKTRLNRLGHLFEKGTKPHIIMPKRRGGVLELRGLPGERVFATSVRHPGTKARPWLIPALDAKKEAVTRDIADRIGKEVEKARQRGL